MNSLVKKIAVASLLFAPLVNNVAWADEAVLNERIARLERIIKGQGLVSLLGRVDQLQNEVQRLNGDNETLRHQLNAMKRRQREMYIDLDGRMQAPAPSSTVGAGSNLSSAEQAQQTVITESIDIVQPEVAVVEKSTPTKKLKVAKAKSKLAVELPASPVAIENGEAAYQSALQTLRGGQYEEAITALSAFPEQYPQSSYLPNAYYWQGEANYVLRNFDAAIKAFQTVIEQFPVSSKVADATLKQGFSQYELGNVDMAKANLAKVIEQYPSTSAARLAKVRLERIGKETR
jgi:tol-pal system protein YbgF